MRRHGPGLDDPTPQQAPLMGVLSVLLLLIPALVLMGEVTRFATIDVSPPRYTALDGEHDRTIYCGRFAPQLRVAVGYDGFYTRLGQEPWHFVGSVHHRYDHDALAAVVAEYKREYPNQVVATISAEDDVPYGVLVETLDTVRGRECRLAGALAGEEIPESCLLWSPVVEAPDHTLHPPHARDPHWPPRRVPAGGGEPLTSRAG